MDDEVRDLLDRMTALELRGAVENVQRENVERRLLAIEDTLVWLVRLILGAFIMAAIAYALKGGLNIV